MSSWPAEIGKTLRAYKWWIGAGFFMLGLERGWISIPAFNAVVEALKGLIP